MQQKMTIVNIFFKFVSDWKAKCHNVYVNSYPNKSLTCRYLGRKHTFIIDQRQCRTCTANTAGLALQTLQAMVNLEVCNLEAQLLTSYNRPVCQVWIYQICGLAKCLNHNHLQTQIFLPENLVQTNFGCYLCIVISISFKISSTQKAEEQGTAMYWDIPCNIIQQCLLWTMQPRIHAWLNPPQATWLASPCLSI